MDKLKDLSVAQVISVYKGRDGECCCGCAGTHTYNPGFKDLAGESRGYEIDDEEVNLAIVKRILNKVKKHASEAEDGGSYFSYATPGGKRYSNKYRDWMRTKGTLYIVYLAPTPEEVEQMRKRRAESKRAYKIQVEEAVKGAGI